MVFFVLEGDRLDSGLQPFGQESQLFMVCALLCEKLRCRLKFFLQGFGLSIWGVGLLSRDILSVLALSSELLSVLSVYGSSDSV